VGLPLLIQFAKSGAQVLGLDVDQTKVDSLNNGESYIKHISSADLQARRTAGRLEATADFSRIRELGAVLICVPTPLDTNREPDLSYVLNTGRAIAPHLQKGVMVSLESTTYPGTTEDELRIVLEEGSSLKAGIDFHLAYSPEREDPGNPDSKVAKIPKVIGGYTPVCLDKAKAVYGLAIETLVPVSSCRAAEATKLLENIFRSVNIALVNELKLIYREMDVDIWETIEAAKTKPFGYTPFYPGPGLGGHCIPIDPFYLSWKAKQCDMEARFIELAGEVNRAMPDRVVDDVATALEKSGKRIAGSRVLLLGLAYKGDVADVREAPSFVLWNSLEERGARVSYYDPHVSSVPHVRDHAGRFGEPSVAWSREIIGAFDCVLIVTKHAECDGRR
jgi:UDP-N-acetyl-D-glucosamine dehydrogenase